MSVIKSCIVALVAVTGLRALNSVSRAEGRAEPATTPAELTVEDSGDLFSADAITKAKKTVAESKGKGSRQVHIESFKSLSEKDRKDFDAAGDDKDKLRAFWNNWAKSKIGGDHGILILIVRSPGHVQPLVDKQMRDAGFSDAKEEKITKMLLDAFHKAKKAKDDGESDAKQQALRDEGLQEVADYLKAELPTSVVQKGSAPPTSGKQEPQASEPQGIGIGGWICLGIVAVAGVWLVIGLIRGFSGGGGGGYGGGGGGGFMTGLLGGMFGGLAGAWIYDRFFGGGGSSAWGAGPQHGGYGSGGDYSGDAGGGTVDTPGAGDFSGDAGGGGDFGGDIGGGGDFGGGDMGGGGGGDF